MKYLRKNRGSLTVEAVISFTVFLSVMFLLLTMVKLVLVMTILNNAAVETAKTVATSLSYPIAIANEIQGTKVESKIEKLEPDNLKSSGVTVLKETALSLVTGGSAGLKSSLLSGGSALKDIMEGLIVNLAKDDFYDFKGEQERKLCADLVEKYVTDCGINFDTEKLMLRAIKFPETEVEYKTLHADNMNLSEDGSLFALPSTSYKGDDGDFNADDVIICLEYPYQIAMPFLPSFEVTLRSTAVEHAWVNGTGVGAKHTEGIKIGSVLSKSVYIGTVGYSKSYHKENCFTLWRGSKSISLSEAKSRKYTACKVCNPPEK